MATQIQIGNTNRNWQHKYNMITQIQQGDTNAAWLHKYKLEEKINWQNKYNLVTQILQFPKRTKNNQKVLKKVPK